MYTYRSKIGVGTLVLLLIFTVTGCRQKKTIKGAKREIRVEVSSPVSRTFCYRIPVQGTVVPVELATISARTDGILDALRVSEGETVKAGQMLFQIDRKNLENKVEIARKELKVLSSELRSAKIALDLSKIVAHKAKIDFDRACTLKRTNSISQESYESSEVTLKQSESEISKAEANVEYATAKLEQQESQVNIAAKDLADSSSCAPYDAVIAEKLVEPGEYVKQGTPILKIENQNLLEVTCFISAVYYNDVLPGTTCVIFKIDDKAAGEAVVTYRAPSIDPQSRTFKVKMLLPKNSPLVSGMLCGVDLILNESKGIGTISDAILLRDNGDSILFTYENGIAKEHKVTPGITDGRYTELVGSPELQNSKIVTKGQSFVNDGDKLLLIAGSEK